ncbi:MAG: HDIG domain-containing protein [Candidatus Sumerlaeaceae bacterium]|nr:HDIG domain-containing protein [Candidatus Sumerlaeaceae bacterium]
MAKILRLAGRGDSGSRPPKRLPGGLLVAGRRTRLAGVLTAVFILLVTVVSPRLPLRVPDVSVGEPWGGPTIVAPFDIRVVDAATAEDARRLVEQRHETVFVLDATVEADALRRLERMLALVRDAAKDRSTTVAALRRDLAAKAGVALEPTTVEVLLDQAGSERLQADLTAVLSHMYSSRVLCAEKSLYDAAGRSGRLAVMADREGRTATTVTQGVILGFPGEAMDYLQRNYLPEFRLPSGLQSAYADIVRQLLRPNLIYDRDLTQRRKSLMLASLDESVTIGAGEQVVAAGELVTPLQAQALRQLVLETRSRGLMRIGGSALLVALMLGFAARYLPRFQARVPLSPRHVLLMAVPVAAAVMLGRLALALGLAEGARPFVLPTAFVAMVLLLVYNARLALVMTVFTTVLFAMAVGSDTPLLLASLAGGFAGTAALMKVSERQQVLTAGLWVSLANVVVAVASSLMSGRLLPPMPVLAAAAGNGIACYLLAVGALPAIEKLFGVVTGWRLMELTSTSHPLLRQMEEKAPGSYQHVLNVTKLAESGAEAVEADRLLVRAGALFHDVGKMLKPKYFTENQVTADERRIHSRLSPYMSALIIKNHVKDGVELARSNGLPETVVEFIPQHHGTSLIRYFYMQAKARAEANDQVLEDEFRYPGPKPQSIEAAIVMIADAVEASATAKLRTPVVREEDVRRVVRDAINDKFQDGQFDECHMTLRDLHEINEALVRALLSRYHQRVDYPNAPRREVRDVLRAEGPPAAAL